jgi:hypothetical protein
MPSGDWEKRMAREGDKKRASLRNASFGKIRSLFQLHNEE